MWEFHFVTELTPILFVHNSLQWGEDISKGARFPSILLNPHFLGKTSLLAWFSYIFTRLLFLRFEKSGTISKREQMKLFKYYITIFFWDFLTHSPTLCVSLVSKNAQFLSPSTLSSAYVKYEWSLSISFYWDMNTFLLHN